MLLSMENIYKNYLRGKNEVPVLKNVHLQVEQGEYLAIMGPSGSGKTTLMNLIGCLDKPTSGSYRLAGRNIAQKRDNELADLRNKYIGFVFQNFYLLPKMTALDNVALPLLYAGVPKGERIGRAMRALHTVGLDDRIHFRPNQLSGGQCQRVAIARAIVTKPSLLLADEPTGALDTASGEQIMELFSQLNNNGVTIIMITHEQAIADCARRICHIRDGVLTGGTTTQFKEQIIGEFRDDFKDTFTDSFTDLLMNLNTDAPVAFQPASEPQEAPDAAKEGTGEDAGESAQIMPESEDAQAEENDVPPAPEKAEESDLTPDVPAEADGGTPPITEETAEAADSQDAPEDFENDAQDPPEDFENDAQDPPEDFESDAQDAPEDFESDAQDPPEDFESDAQDAPEDFENDAQDAEDDFSAPLSNDMASIDDSQQQNDVLAGAEETPEEGAQDES